MEWCRIWAMGNCIIHFQLSLKTLSIPQAIGKLKENQESEVEEEAMDGIQQVALPVLGILAASALTFYAVSFSEIREKSFRELEESESEDGGFKTTLRSRERRAIRKAKKQNKS